MRDFSVIIPTWNMGQYLEPLFDSIVNSEFGNVVEEIIFVCEKSTDGSEAVIAKLTERQVGRLPIVRLIQPDQRRGLFVARYLGAKAARAKTIMFIDSRITLPAASARALPFLIKKYPAMISNVDIDVGKNIFCLYWRRSHATFFRSEVQVQNVVTITPQNFHSTRIGGTCFYCNRELFIEISERYVSSPLISDDTYVFADMVEREPLVMHPDFRINWEPRDTPMVFLKHLYGRGPGLAQYHFYRKRGALFYATLMGVLYALATALFLFIKPLVAIGMILGAAVILLLSTALIARGLKEFFRLAPLHAAVLVFYGMGAVRGAWVVWKKSAGTTRPLNKTGART